MAAFRINVMSDHQPEEQIHIPQLLGRFWTFANLLSLIRMVLVVPITYLIWIDGPLSWILGLIFVAMATDWFDGRVARWSHTVSEWGKVLDPLADKLAAVMIVSALVARPGPYSLPLWLLVLVVVRDALIVAGGFVLAKRRGVVVMSVWLGKVAITALALTVLAVLFRADPPVLQLCVVATAVLFVVSFLIYAARYVRLMRRGNEGQPVHEPGEAAMDPVRESIG